MHTLLGLAFGLVWTASCTPVGGADPDGSLAVPDDDLSTPAQVELPDDVVKFDLPEDHHPSARSIDLSPPREPCVAASPSDDVAPVDDPLDPKGGRLVVERDDGTFVGLPLRKTSFDTVVTGTVAETLVTQEFHNALEEPIEAVYTFPLPHDGAVDDYGLRIGDRHVRGVILRREEAKETYDKAKEAGHSAGLLEQERPNIFTQSVANIPPGASIHVTMHVVQPLTPEAGRYSLVLPTTVGPRYMPGAPIASRSGSGEAPDTTDVPDASRISPPVLEGRRTCGDLEVTVAIDAGVPIEGIRSRAHEVNVDRGGGEVIVSLDENFALLDRDFVLSWSTIDVDPRAILMADPDEDGDGGWFTLTVDPPAEVPHDEAVRRELVFVIDASGSMNGRPMKTAKDTARRFLEGLRPGEAFSVLRFSTDASGLGPELLPSTDVNVERGIEFIDALAGTGGTEMKEGIRAALAMPHDPTRKRYVVFLTDGYIGNERQIFDLVADEIGDTRLFALGVGSSPNRYLLDGLAHMGAGVAHYVDNTEKPRATVRRLYEQLRTPALTDLDVEIKGLDARDIVPRRLPDLFVGQPVVLFGRYEGELKGSAVVKGQRGGKTVEIPVQIETASAEHADGLASMWARHRITELQLDPSATDPHGQLTASVRDKVTDLSLKYRVLTEFTGFVAVDASKVVEHSGSHVTVVQGADLAEGMNHSYKYGSPQASAPLTTQSGGMGLIGTGRGGGGSGSGSGSGSGFGLGGGYGRGSGTGLGERGKRIPKVRQAKAVVKRGHVDQAIIRRIVRAHVAEVRACYNHALQRDPAATGRVRMQFVIDGSGAVAAAVVLDTEIEDKRLGKCLRDAMKTWQFPRAQDAGPVVVTYPFVFQRTEDDLRDDARRGRPMARRQD